MNWTRADRARFKARDAHKFTSHFNWTFCKSVHPSTTRCSHNLWLHLKIHEHAEYAEFSRGLEDVRSLAVERTTINYNSSWHLLTPCTQMHPASDPTGGPTFVPQGPSHTPENQASVAPSAGRSPGAETSRMSRLCTREESEHTWMYCHYLYYRIYIYIERERI